MAHRLNGPKVRKIARDHGDATGYAIARRIGVAESTISRALRGESSPGLNTLVSLASAYGIPIEDLLDDSTPVAA
jgi:transcriptional regulator with XRE-family HTH domain